MSRPGPFGHPYCLGFDEVERLVERLARGHAEAYPPVNIEEVAQDTLRLTLAVAGFAPEQLSITLTGRELTVKGERTQLPEGRTYLHKESPHAASSVVSCSLKTSKSGVPNWPTVCCGSN